MGGHYISLSIAKPHAVALLALLRFAERTIDRPLTLEEAKGLESLEFAIEGKDRRKVNRFKPTKGKPTLQLHLRRKRA